MQNMNGTRTFDYSAFNATGSDMIQFAISSRDWIALILMTLGTPLRPTLPLCLSI